MLKKLKSVQKITEKKQICNNCYINIECMARKLTKQEIIDDIEMEARKLNKMELQILLARLRVKKLATGKRKPVANYDSRKIKAPTMEEIDTWKHESRKY